MSFLKRLGQAAKAVITTAERLDSPVSLALRAVRAFISAEDPKAAPIVQIVQSDVARFFGVIENVEKIMPQATQGADKLKAAAPLVAAEFLDIIDKMGFKVADKDKLAGALTGLTSTLVDAYNSLDAK